MLKLKSIGHIETPIALKHTHSVSSALWSPHNKYLLMTGCYDGLLRIYDLATKDVAAKVLKGHNREINCIAWHPHFDYMIASGGADTKISIWNTKSVIILVSIGNSKSTCRPRRKYKCNNME